MFEMPGYRTLGVIGNSGDIKLYRLMRYEDGRMVIAKTTCDEYPGPVMVDTFRYEYDMLRKLGGRGVVEVYSLEIMADRPVLLLQDMEGSTLDRVLRSHANTLDLSARLRIAASAADCLMQLHRDNITLNERD
ncbi:MAG: protein kinase [Bacillota bacterium]